jgi:hypothetical protein
VRQAPSACDFFQQLKAIFLNIKRFETIADSFDFILFFFYKVYKYQAQPEWSTFRGYTLLLV